MSYIRYLLHVLCVGGGGAFSLRRQLTTSIRWIYIYTSLPLSLSLSFSLSLFFSFLSLLHNNDILNSYRSYFRASRISEWIQQWYLPVCLRHTKSSCTSGTTKLKTKLFDKVASPPPPSLPLSISLPLSVQTNINNIIHVHVKLQEWIRIYS